MSFYEIQNNPILRIKDPLLVLGSAVTLANSTISIPTGRTTISGTAGVLTAEALLSGYIVRNGTASNDTTDSATNIITALRRKINEIKSSDSVSMPNGTSFTFKLFNNTNQNPYEVLPGAGVTFGASDGEINQGNATISTMIVTGQTALGDASNTISIINGDY